MDQPCGWILVGLRRLSIWKHHTERRPDLQHPILLHCINGSSCKSFAFCLKLSRDTCFDLLHFLRVVLGLGGGVALNRGYLPVTLCTFQKINFVLV